MFGFDPGTVIGGKAAGGNEHVDMGMKEHGARPGVKDRKRTDTRAKVAGIVGQFPSLARKLRLAPRDGAAGRQFLTECTLCDIRHSEAQLLIRFLPGLQSFHIAHAA